MSALNFLTSGGMAQVGGDLSEGEQKELNNAIRLFSENLREKGRSLQIPASLIRVHQSAYILMVKDTNQYHFVFGPNLAGNSIQYRDFTKHGRLDLQTLVHQVRIEIGEVIWAFSIPIKLPKLKLEEIIEQRVTEYVNAALQTQARTEKQISNEALAFPEIAAGLDRFRASYPNEEFTAFVMMQFADTIPHEKIIETIKSVLMKNGITALRADDKQFMDDLYPNVKVYMHACDFGIAVFDRIIQNDINPNVSFEVGYMLGIGKDVLLLKDKTLNTLQTDLVGKLYKKFDTTNIEDSLPKQINKWLTDKGYIDE